MCGLDAGKRAAIVPAPGPLHPHLAVHRHGEPFAIAIRGPVRSRGFRWSSS
jgi:hypothetical protein